MRAPSKTLKEGNLKWLVGLVTLDILIIGASIATVGASPWLIAGRASFVPLLPVAVLIATNAIPHQLKDVLVYWKSSLPGHQAFTKYGPRDPRISMVELRKNVGPLPSDPAEQNPFWYKLYRQVDSDAAVVEAHKMFVLFRDAAALSFLCLLLVPVTLYFAGLGRSAYLSALAVFSFQYVLTAVAARFNGVRFVTNVLAVHSAEKPRAPRR